MMTCCNQDCNQGRACPNRGGGDVDMGHAISFLSGIGVLAAALAALIWMVVL